MAYFAEIDETNIVVRVLSVGDDEEHRGQEFLAADLGLGGTWIQTSYNTRGNVHVGEDGESYERGAGGLLAQIIQHENNHLDGILFPDIAEQVYTKEEMEKRGVREAKG